jgi:hypothetical protein
MTGRTLDAVTLVGWLEVGYPDSMEAMIWRQLRGAYGCKLHLFGPDDALSVDEFSNRVFLIPPKSLLPGQGVPLTEYGFHTPVTYVFGRPGENLQRFVTPEDSVVYIQTPNETDLMAVTAAGIVLNEHR